MIVNELDTEKDYTRTKNAYFRGFFASPSFARRKGNYFFDKQ